MVLWSVFQPTWKEEHEFYQIDKHHKNMAFHSLNIFHYSFWDFDARLWQMDGQVSCGKHLELKHYLRHHYLIENKKTLKLNKH